MGKMKIEDGIIKQLADMEYQQLDIKTSYMDMFYHSDQDRTEIILILRAITGDEITSEEYKLITSNIKNSFIERGFSDIHLLGLIITAMPKRAKKFIIEQDDHIIVDLWDRRLIIYENQSSNFSTLIPIIENIIHEDAYDTGLDKSGYGKSYKANPIKMQWVSLFNTLLIVANIIIYLLLHNTELIGGSYNALQKGALSWDLIKNKGEYYRILTSMFLHSDFEHLVNNMIVLFFVGYNLERAIGKSKYLIIYFGSGIIAGISSMGYNMIKERWVFSIGASGAIFGVVGAMVYILLVNKGRLQDISSRQIILFTIFSLYGGIANTDIDNAAHIGGFVGGVILAIILYRKQKSSLKKSSPVEATDEEGVRINED